MSLDLPSFGSFLAGNDQAPPTPAPVAPEASGDGNWLTSGFLSGLHSTIGAAGLGGEAAARVVGADSAADSAKAFADQQRATAATYARKDLEEGSLWNPAVMGYKVAQSLPMLGGALLGTGAAALGGLEALPAGIIGGGLAMLPSMVGENVQAREDYTGKPIDSSGAMKAIGYGVPEAALQGLLPAQLEAGVLKGVGHGLLGTVAKAGLTQAPVQAATTYLTQQMGDPNRSFASRAQEIVESALTGGVLGAVTGAGMHAIAPARAPEAKAPEPGASAEAPPAAPAAPPTTRDVAKTNPNDVSVDTLGATVDAALAPPPPLPPPTPPAEALTPLQARIAAIAERPTGAALPSAVPVTPEQARAAALADRGDQSPQARLAAIAERPTTLSQGPGTFLDPNLPMGVPARPDVPPPETTGPFGRRVRNLPAIVPDQGAAVPDIERMAQAVAGDRDPSVEALLGVAAPAAEARGGPLTVVPEPVKPTGRALAVVNNAPRQAPRGKDLTALAEAAAGKPPSDPALEGLLGITPPAPGVTARAVVPVGDVQDLTPPQGSRSRALVPVGKVEPTRATPAAPPADQVQAMRDIVDANPPLQPVTEPVSAMQARRAALAAQRGPDRDASAKVAQIKAAAEANANQPPLMGGPVPYDWAARQAELRKAGALSGDARTMLKDAAPASEADLQRIVAANILPKVQKGEPLKGTVQKLGVNTKVLNPDGTVAPEFKAAANGDTSGGNALGPIPSTSAAPKINEGIPRTAAKPSRVGLWDDAEALKARLMKRDLSDPAVVGDINEVVRQQSKTQVDSATARSIRESLNAIRKGMEARESAPQLPLRLEPTDGPPQTGAPSAQASEFTSRFKSLREGLRTETPARPSPVEQTPDFFAAQSANVPADVEARDQLKQAGAAAGTIKHDPESTREAIEAAKTANDAKATQTRVALTPDGGTPAPHQVQSSFVLAREALKQIIGKGAAGLRPGADVDPAAYAKALAERQAHLDAMERDTKAKGLEGMAAYARANHFDDTLTDLASGNMATPDLEGLLTIHQEEAQRLIAAAKAVQPESPLLGYDTPPTQHDVDLRHVIDTTGSAKAALGYIAEHGSTPQARELAARLLRAGVDASIRMAHPDEFAGDTTRAVREGEKVFGSHNDALNRINVYDGSNVERTLLHEAAHAATVRAIAGDGPAGREIRDLFDRLKAASPDNDAYGLANAKEFVAEAMSNPEFQRFLKGERVSTGSKVSDLWQGFKNAVFKALGMPERVRTLFDQVMDTSTRLMGENVRQARVVGESALHMNGAVEQVTRISQRSYAENLKALKETLEGTRRGFFSKTRPGTLSWVTGDHLSALAKPLIPSVEPWTNAVNHVMTRQDLLGKVDQAALNKVDDLIKANSGKKLGDVFNRLMARSAQDIDPRKSWKEHIKPSEMDPNDPKRMLSPAGPLHGLPEEQLAVLKEEHADAQHDLDILRGITGGTDAYTGLIFANITKDHMKLMHSMYDFYKRELEVRGPDGAITSAPLRGFNSDPFAEYDRASKLHDDPAEGASRVFDRTDAMVKSLTERGHDFIETSDALGKERQVLDAREAERAKADPKAPVPEEYTRRAKELKQQAQDALEPALAINELIREYNAVFDRSLGTPYFHLGRTGDQFVSAHVVSDGDVPRPGAIKAIAQHMAEHGFDNAVIAQGLSNDSIYVRLDSEMERDRLYDLMRGMREQGWIHPTKDIARGAAGETSIYMGIAPKHIQRAIAALSQKKVVIPEGATEAQAQALVAAHNNNIRDMARAWMNLLPDSSMTKLYARRKDVQGFSRDMLKSYRSHAVDSARGLAGLTMDREIGEHAGEMQDDLEALNKSPDVTGEQLTKAGQIMAELSIRHNQRSSVAPNGMMDGLRHMGHIFQVGTSPAYGLTLLSQNFTLSLPEMGKTHGYVAAAKAMGLSAADSLKIVKAIAFGKEGAVFGMRREDLVKAGLSERSVKLMMDGMARGLWNQGSYTEAMTGHEGKPNSVHNLASAFGRYSEMHPRILAALAADKLFEQAPEKAGYKGPRSGEAYDKARMDFVQKVVTESQFNWNPALNARQTTKNGMFGPMGPMLNQFMGFQIRMTEKLYREFADGFGKQRPGETAEAAQLRNQQSRKWLVGHMAAVTMLAGTLGLPMVSVAASVYDRLADLVTGQDDHDITATYRTWLAHNFGKEVGEAVARGAPRLGGIDMSHLGEGSLAPGSRLIEMLSEKRKVEDAEKDWLKAEAGHSVGFLMSLALAGRDASNGDFLDASIKVLPELLKGPAEAYRLGQRGYSDSKGARQPISPGAQDIVEKVLGIDPAREAEYDEEKRVETGLARMRDNRSQNITKHLLLAANRNDQPMYQKWVQEAMGFQQDHPGMVGPLAGFGHALQTQMKNSAIARGMGVPIGVQARDLVGRGMTSFGNLRNGQQ